MRYKVVGVRVVFEGHVWESQRKTNQRKPAAASNSRLDLGCAPYVLYGVKYIDPVTLALFLATVGAARRMQDRGIHLCWPWLL